MSQVQKVSVSVTTDSGGDATAFSSGAITGKLSQIRYVKTDFANGSTITVTAESTGETLWSETNVNASATRAPRQATHTTAGVASVYASNDGVLDKIAIANDRVKIVVSSGGDTKTGTFHFVFE